MDWHDDPSQQHDREVLVLRHVKASFAFAVDDGFSREGIQDRMSDAISDTIRTHGNDSEMVMRFDDQAEFVSCFLRDLLQDRAWDKWYFGAFRKHQGQSKRDVISNVLLENAELLTSISKILSKMGVLGSLLGLLGTEKINRLCQIDRCDRNESWIQRPVVDVVFRLADRLRWWSGVRPRKNDVIQDYLNSVRGDGTSPELLLSNLISFLLQREKLLQPLVTSAVKNLHAIQSVVKHQGWLDAAVVHRSIHLALQNGVEFSGSNTFHSMRPLFAAALRIASRLGMTVDGNAESKLFERFISRFPKIPDWTETKELASVVASALRLIMEEQGSASSWQIDESALKSATSDEGWLDRDALHRLIIKHSAQKEDKTQPTHGYRRLWDDIQAAFDVSTRQLKRDQPRHRDNATRILQALESRNPHWAGNELAAEVIDALLDAWQSLLNGENFATRKLLPSVPDLAVVAQCEKSIVSASAQRFFADILGTRDDNATNIGPANDPVTTDGEVVNSSPLVLPGGRIETDAIATYLLLRTISDLRLASLFESVSNADRNTLTGWPSLLIGLGMRWSDIEFADDGSVDEGLLCLVQTHSTIDRTFLRDSWGDVGNDELRECQQNLLRQLAGLRMISGENLFVHQRRLPGGQTAWVAGDGATGIWPLVKVEENHAKDTPFPVDDWLTDWEEVFGIRPTLVTGSRILSEIGRDFSCRSESDTQDYGRSAHRFEQIFQHYRAGDLELPLIDTFVSLLASIVVRCWARWLRQFANSSDGYLLENLLRRPGHVTVSPYQILVETESRPLDVVLSLAGYTDDMGNLPWLGGRKIQFRLGGPS